jgi:ADP-heptose:LPS heptosyltransferase
MHILRNSKPIAINYGQVLEPGAWIVQDEHAFLWGMLAERGTVQINRFDFPSSGQPPRKVLVIRSGAIGDLLLLTPALVALKTLHPEAEIDVCFFAKNAPILSGVTESFVPYPPPESMSGLYDTIFCLEGVVEQSTDDRIHATDAFARVLGVTVTDYRPVYQVTPEEHQDAVYKYPRADGTLVKRNPRVAIQPMASSRIRDYPLNQWQAIIDALIKRGWEVLLYGAPGQLPPLKNAPRAIRDCSHLTFREAAAVLLTCDVFCGVDSSFFNLCPALGVPAIGLFGPVDWRTRIKEGSGQHALAGLGDCAPCGWTNSRQGRQFPEHGPCAITGYCVPLVQISVERIIAKIDAHSR